jgi:hypothetical protein
MVEACITWTEWKRMTGISEPELQDLHDRIAELCRQKKEARQVLELLKLHLDWMKVQEVSALTMAPDKRPRNYITAIRELTEKLKEIHPEIDQGVDYARTE